MVKGSKKQTDIRVIQEVAAIILVPCGLLLFLALISFDAGDVPFLTYPANDPPNNFVGTVGAYVAAGLFLGIGRSAYVLPFLSMFFGATLFFNRKINFPMKLLWLTLLLLSGASLVQLVADVFAVSSLEFEYLKWAGGNVGYYLNDRVLSAFLGPVGAGIILCVVYAVSLFLLFEIRPAYLVQSGVEMFRKWKEAREEALINAADPLERLTLEQRRLARKERELKKRLEKEKGGTEWSEEGEADLEKVEERGGEKVEKKRRSPARRKKKVETQNEPALNDENPSAGGVGSGGSLTETGVKIAEVEKDGKGAVERVDVTVEEPVEVKVEEKPRVKKVERRKKKVVIQDEEEEMVLPSSLPSYENYVLPDVDFLEKVEQADGAGSEQKAQLEQDLAILVDTLDQFGIQVEAGDVTVGSTITRYEVLPARGVRVERISSLAKNVARALKAEKVNILAPIPGKDTVGIEVGSKTKQMVTLRELFESNVWRTTKAKIPIALGKDIYGAVLLADLADMPHLLIAGSTGSGKSVCINTILMSLAYRFSPDDLRLILVDPKVVELQVYNKLPHLMVPVVTEPKKVLMALRLVIQEMEKRYRYMAQMAVRNIGAYNAAMAKKKKQREEEAAERQRKAEEEEALIAQGEEPADEEIPVENDLFSDEQQSDADLPEHLPYIVVIIDELADLMQTAPADVNLAIGRLAQKARAAGVHLILATQTPRKEVITGVIKTNIPCRVAFQVPSSLDSRVILDESGAENLLGRGDLLYSNPKMAKLIRAQGAFVSEEEVNEVVAFISEHSEVSYDQEIQQQLSKPESEGADVSDADEELIDKGIAVIKQERRASTSLLQRRLRIGYSRASWIIDQLEDRGMIGPREGAKDREILMDLDDNE